MGQPILKTGDDQSVINLRYQIGSPNGATVDQGFLQESVLHSSSHSFPYTDNSHPHFAVVDISESASSSLIISPSANIESSPTHLNDVSFASVQFGSENINKAKSTAKAPLSNDNSQQHVPQKINLRALMTALRQKASSKSHKPSSSLQGCSSSHEDNSSNDSSNNSLHDFSNNLPHNSRSISLCKEIQVDPLDPQPPSNSRLNCNDAILDAEAADNEVREFSYCGSSSARCRDSTVDLIDLGTNGVCASQALSAPEGPPSCNKIMASTSSSSNGVHTAASVKIISETIDLTQSSETNNAIEVEAAPSAVLKTREAKILISDTTTASKTTTASPVGGNINGGGGTATSSASLHPLPHVSNALSATNLGNDSLSSSLSRFAGRPQILLEELERREDIKELTPRQLKEILTANLVAYKEGCERWELEDSVKTLWNKFHVYQEVLTQNLGEENQIGGVPHANFQQNSVDLPLLDKKDSPNLLSRSKTTSTSTSINFLWPLIQTFKDEENEDLFHIPQQRGPRVLLAKLPVSRKKGVCQRQIENLSKKFLELAAVSVDNIVDLIVGMVKQSGKTEEVLDRLGVMQAFPVDPLRLRKALEMSGTKMRVLIKELKICRVKVKSNYWAEKETKKIQEKMGSYVEQYVPLLVNKEDPSGTKKGAKTIVKEDRPVVYHSDLKKYVQSVILMLEELGQLEKNKQGVTPGTIEIQWTADKSDSVFLMSFHVMNVVHAQSPDNAHCVLMFEAPDSYQNLQTVLELCDLGNLL